VFATFDANKQLDTVPILPALNPTAAANLTAVLPAKTLFDNEMLQSRVLKPVELSETLSKNSQLSTKTFTLAESELLIHIPPPLPEEVLFVKTVFVIFT
jgi:hypothetical protein